MFDVDLVGYFVYGEGFVGVVVFVSDDEILEDLDLFFVFFDDVYVYFDCVVGVKVGMVVV